MKKFIKIISLLMALLFVLGAFAACTPPEAPSEDDDEPKNSVQIPEETEPPADPITLTAEYVVVRPELCSDVVKEAAIAVKDALGEATGSKIGIKEDSLYGNMKPAQYEILVGVTNREESARAADKIKYHDYIVTIDGDKLVICAYTDEKIAEAVEYAKGLIANSLTITENERITVRAEYRFDSVNICNIDISDYTIVYSRKSSALIKSAANELQRGIVDACGIYLPIKNENSGETEKEILIGDTEREASKTIDAEALGEYGYAIKAEGSKIVIKTNDMDFTLMQTIKNIAKELETGIVDEAEGKLQMSETPLFTSFMFTDVHNNFAMLEPTNNFGKYIVRKNVDMAIDHLLATEGPVDVVLVGGDLISDYHSWNSSGKWPYKYFVEYRELLVNTFKRLSKDGKVSYVAGNHDYAQGELATDGPGKNGSYNSFDFYFGDVGMRQDWGELPPEDMFVKVGEKTGEKYLLAYYYEVDGIGFVGLSPDHDHPGVWSAQGSGFDAESLKWLDKKLDEVDPDGNKIIFVNCHYFYDHRTKIEDDGTNKYANSQGYDRDSLVPVFLGHKNLFHIFGHGEVWFNDTTVRYVSHHNKSGKVIDVKGTETDSTQLIQYANRDFTSIYGGHFRADANNYAKWFEKDYVIGYAGLSTYGYTHRSTCTPRVAQGLYIEIFEDRIVFTMMNFGDYPGWTTDDLITPYTVYLYK